MFNIINKNTKLAMELEAEIRQRNVACLDKRKNIKVKEKSVKITDEDQINQLKSLGYVR